MIHLDRLQFLIKMLFGLDRRATLKADQCINLATQFFVAPHGSMCPTETEPQNQLFF